MDTAYSATVRRDGRWWFVYVPKLDIAGQSRTLGEVEEVAREVIGLALDIDPDPIVVSVTVETPEDVRALWEEAARGDEQARNAASQAAQRRREAVRRVTAMGVSQADAARLFQVSPQRISQLVHG